MVGHSIQALLQSGARETRRTHRLMRQTAKECLTEGGDMQRIPKPSNPDAMDVSAVERVDTVDAIGFDETTL